MRTVPEGKYRRAWRIKPGWYIKKGYRWVRVDSRVIKYNHYRRTHLITFYGDDGYKIASESWRHRLYTRNEKGV